MKTSSNEVGSYRLNLGCGERTKKGYINVDLYSEKADLQMDVTRLNFSDNYFSLVEARHVVEHLGYVGSINMLSETFRVLKPDGELIIETPDIEKTFVEFVGANEKSKKAKLLNWVYGLEYPGYYHRFCFPKEALVELLGYVGFEKIEYAPPEYRTFPAYCIRCKKPSKPEPYQTYAIARRKMPLKNGTKKEYLSSLDLEKKVVWKSLTLIKKFVATGEKKFFVGGLETLKRGCYSYKKIEKIFTKRLSKYAKE
jgi:predicted SAM-dependent methyltransferase